MGKTKTTMSLVARLLGAGVKFLVLDPEDEYCSALASLGFHCLYAGDAYIDFLMPAHEEAVVKASDVAEPLGTALGLRMRRFIGSIICRTGGLLRRLIGY